MISTEGAICALLIISSMQTVGWRVYDPDAAERAIVELGG